MSNLCRQVLQGLHTNHQKRGIDNLILISCTRRLNSKITPPRNLRTIGIKMNVCDKCKLAPHDAALQRHLCATSKTKPGVCYKYYFPN